MISRYEIRENSLTQNSVFLLLIKGDEQGCNDIKRELSSFCKLIDAKVKGFDYVFELSGITDDSMLEKLRTRLDSLSAAVFGSTQTFGNVDKTKITDISSGEKLEIEESFVKDANKNQINILEEDVNESTETIPLAQMGEDFPVEKEDKNETSFEDIPAESTLVQGDEKRIEIGEASLKLAKTIPNIKEQGPSMRPLPKTELNISQGEQQMSKENEVEKKLTDEAKEKTGLFKNIFGKIKSAMHSENQQSPSQNVSETIQKNDVNNAENVNLETNEKETEQIQEDNPFQNLGEGIIVKKSLLEENSNVSTKQQKAELTENSVTAKLQVDDIFAAETVCDFYENQPEEQKQGNEVLPNKESSPLEILEQGETKERKEEIVEGKTSEDSLPTKNEEKIILKEDPSQDFVLTPKNNPVKEEDNDLAKITLPDQVFEQQKREDNNKTPVKGEEKIPTNKKNVSEEKQGKVLKKNVIMKQAVKKEEARMAVLPKEGKNNMKEGNAAFSKPRTATKISNKGMLNQNVIGKNAKIDHTLHVATPEKDAKYKNYPIEMPLIPTYTFANMDVSSIRFAHAIAMATLDDLGNGNNPLVLQGVGGTGKTHFLHAMGYEISKKIPQSKILFTNGVRLSRGVQYLLEKGQKEQLDKFFNNAEVLIIDDIHLTAVNEHNREYISKVLNDFLKNKKQIILSSKYPPESLKRFEELVNFKFSVGSVAELKVPNPNHFVRLANKIVAESSLELTDKEVQSFFCAQNDSLGDVARDVKRVKVLSRRIESSGIKKLSYVDILKEMTAINGENTKSEISKKAIESITVLEKNKGVSWGNFGFFFPASSIDKFRWVAFAAQEAAKELGIKGGFNYALKSAYSTEHIISAAFKIANICDLKGLKGAVILGPSFTECKEPIRDNFYDILTHMLEVMMIRCGTINFEDMKKPSAYVKMLGDILK